MADLELNISRQTCAKKSSDVYFSFVKITNAIVLQNSVKRILVRYKEFKRERLLKRTEEI